MAPAIPAEVVEQRVTKKLSQRNKSINLNCDTYQQFGVPMQVLSLSKLSSFERKQLESRLKRELEQVRTFQKNIEEGFLKSSDVYSCNAGKRKHIHDVLQPVKKRIPNTGNAMLMKQCETILKRLMGHNFGWVFNTPVDVVALKIPDYYTVIKHPMDLGTVKSKLNSGKYVDPWEFAADVRLTFSNASTYNPRGNNVHVMAETLSKFFEVRWKQIEKKLSVAQDSLVPPMKRNVLETEPESATRMPPLKKKKIARFVKERKQEPVKKIMSADDKHKLSSQLEASLADLPEKIIDFLKESSSNGNASMDDEIEIDLDTLSNETLFKLRKLLDDFLVDKQKIRVNFETCEIEIHHDSGPSNSSSQAVKVNDVNEEDVDIGVNDLHVTSFPPLEIEKDTAVKISKCSSLSSSSSDSGSTSSSDSDSESDDDANTSAIVNNIKDASHSEVNLEQTSTVAYDAGERVDFGGVLPQTDLINRAGQVDPKSQSVSVSGHQDAAHAPNERRVSPDKLYRAALLRGRFADIILKAQEETNGKVEEQDRERLRLEKEELERRRKQEAKAAEDAKRKADLEAKRKRQLERETARQAIQKMEKMVDINDNTRLVEDLEIFSAEENNADFCYQKRNPLEQLGLYMKNDDEFEEDGEPRYA